MSFLRTALETADAQEPRERTLVMQGPLSELYTQALNIAYANDEAEVPALETQANDALTEQALLAEASNAEQAPDSTLTIYGVAQSEVSEATVVEVTQALALKPAEGHPGDFVLIMDATRRNPNVGDASQVVQPHVLELNRALETIVLCHGGHVYHSLEQFAELTRGRDGFPRLRA